MSIVDEPDHRLIRLAGRLSAAQVHALLEASGGHQQSLQLNLSELISVDAVGLEALHDLQRAGAQLSEVPTYIQLKLASLSARHARE